MSSVHQPPQANAGDVAHTIVKAALSVVPVVGGPVAEFFALVIAPPLQDRQRRWLEELAECVLKLETKAGLSPEQLRDNPAFVDAVLIATQSAIRTSNHEKREALRNAIVNSVLSNAPPPDVQQLYLSIVDGLSPWQLRLLYLMRDPPAWFERAGMPFPSMSMGSLDALIRRAFPDAHDVDLGSVWRDLNARGLLDTEGLTMTMTGDGLRSRRTTALGSMIVEFTLNRLDEQAG
jgi:hypothetical protein